MNIVEEQHVHLYENSVNPPGLVREGRHDDQDYAFYFGPFTYWTHFVVPILNDPNRHQVVFTAQGSVQLNTSPQDRFADVVSRFSGHNNDWFQSYLHIHLSLPYTQGLYEPTTTEGPGPWQHKSASCIVTLNGFEKGGDNHNGGWTIYNFGWSKDNGRFEPGHGPGSPAEADILDVRLDRYDVWAHIGIRGREFRVDRVGFTFTAIGSVQA